MSKPSSVAMCLLAGEKIVNVEEKINIDISGEKLIPSKIMNWARVCPCSEGMLWVRTR